MIGAAQVSKAAFEEGRREVQVLDVAAGTTAPQTVVVVAGRTVGVE